MVYYSQTGNTKKMAEAISKGIKEANGQCDLFSLREVTPRW